MKGQNAKVSRAFRQLADLLEPLDATDTDLSVTHATPSSDDFLESERVTVEVGVRIPFLDGARRTRSEVTLTPTDARLERDGTLHVDLQANVDRTREDDAVAASSEPRGDETTPNAATEAVTGDEAGGERHASESASDTEAARGSEAGNGDASKPDDDAPTVEDGDGDDTSTVEDGETADGETDELGYRDPERLRTVYEEYDTFAEMTEALDVDVTPQTVRRYMIKYGIHEPLSSTGSRTVAMLVDADPDDVGSMGESSPSRQSGETTEPAASDSEEYPVGAAEAVTE